LGIIRPLVLTLAAAAGGGGRAAVVVSQLGKKIRLPGMVL
jgi:hypothetical protein